MRISFSYASRFVKATEPSGAYLCSKILWKIMFNYGNSFPLKSQLVSKKILEFVSVYKIIK